MATFGRNFPLKAGLFLLKKNWLPTDVNISVSITFFWRLSISKYFSNLFVQSDKQSVPLPQYLFPPFLASMTFWPESAS